MPVSAEEYNAAQKQRSERNDVLEEAAKVAERYGLGFDSDQIAENIRALKQKEPA